MWHDDQYEQRIADMAYDDACDERDKRPGPASRCLTCSAAVDWTMDAVRKTWKPLDHGTETTHRCIDAALNGSSK